MAMRRKFYTAETTDLGPRTVRVICSTGTVDRAGEIIEQSGIDLSQFEANPIILWSHNPEHPIGLATAVKLVDGCLQAEIEFAPDGVSPKADEICGLVKRGIIKTISIGFDPTDSVPMEPSQPKGAQRYKAITLLEISVVSIPANPEALIVERAFQAPQEVLMGKTKAQGDLRVKLLANIQAKGLYDVAQLAYLLNNLGYAQESAAYEAALEEDGSQVPAMLGAAMQALAEAFLAMTREEVAERLAGMATQDDDPDDLDGLDDADAAIVMTAATPLVRKFRAGYLRAKARAAAPRIKSGRTISAATAKTLKTALDLHGEAMVLHKDAIAKHKSAVQIVKGLMPEQGDPTEDEDTEETQSTGETGPDEGSKALSAAYRRRQADLLALSAA